jgi:hypothetical protein
VRSSFEALISIEYIVKEDTNYVPRSLAWLVQYINERIKTYEMFDPSTDKGKDFQLSVQTDDSIKAVPMPPGSQMQAVIERLNSFLARDQLRQINADFHSLKGKKSWYRLYNGPNDLRMLAQSVGRSALYDFMYRQWSRVTHAHDFAPFIQKSQTGQGVIRSIRSPEELKNATNFATVIFLSATRRLIGKFRPTEDIKTWYEREVQPLFTKVYSR